MSYNFSRFMRGMRVSGRVESHGEPLNDEQLKGAVPSIFATDAHASRSARFAPIPTINVLNGLRAEGFDPYSAQQARTRVEGKAEYTKHMLRLRHRSLKNEADEAFEIVLVNANDGTSAYQMIPGFFRFVCANGLMTGTTFEEVKVRHSGNAVQEVIEGAYRVLDEAPMVTEQVQRFRSLPVSDAEREVLASAAHALRFPAAHASEDPKPAPIEPAALIRARRAADRANDLWSTFNVVQENVIRGGQTGWTRNADGSTRRARVREVQGIDQNRHLNRALWMLTERMAELKAAG